MRIVHRLRDLPRRRLDLRGASDPNREARGAGAGFTRRRMSHAGAIVSRGKGTAAGKIEALKAAGIAIAGTPSVMADTLLRHWGKAERQDGETFPFATFASAVKIAAL